MPSGIYVRDPVCPKGHNKNAPNGTYIYVRTRKQGKKIYTSTELRCAQCSRNYQRKFPL